MQKIAAITGGRSDFDRLLWVCRAMEKESSLSVELVAANAHFAPALGKTIDHVRDSGVPIGAEVEMLLATDTASGVARSVGVGCVGMTEAFSRMEPDLIMVLGDRFELLSVVAAAVCLRIPIAHIGGGQVTEGAMDDQIRNVVTKASHLHFVANQQFASRLSHMGEHRDRIFVTGSPSIDALLRVESGRPEGLFESLGLKAEGRTALVTLHPETASATDSTNYRAVFDVLAEVGLQAILTYPNGDPGSARIIELIQQLHSRCPERVVVVPNLGQQRYVTALRGVDVMVGNSSSGIIEASTFDLSVVNVGARQRGRPSGNNVTHVGFDKAEIRSAIESRLATGKKSCDRPYGDGHASERIAKIVAQRMQQMSREELMAKPYTSGV